MSFGENLQALRKKKQLSQEALAEMLGVSFASINRWEKGKFEPTILAKEKLKALFKKNEIDMEVKNDGNE